MANQQKSWNRPREIRSAKADTVIGRYRFVKNGSDNEHKAVATDGSVPIVGVVRPTLTSDPSHMIQVGDTFSYTTEGDPAVEYGETIAVDDPITAGADGRAAVASAGDWIWGYAQTAGVEGDINGVQEARGKI